MKDIPEFEVRYEYIDRNRNDEIVLNLKPCRRCYKERGELIEPKVRTFPITYKGDPMTLMRMEKRHNMHYPNAIYTVFCSNCGYIGEVENGFLGWNDLKTAERKWNDDWSEHNEENYIFRGSAAWDRCCDERMQ